MKNFALSSTSSTYTPPSLEGRGISFILREPNEDEMEKLSTELFRRGCVPVEQGRMRAVLIDELYHLFDEAAADEKAGLLEPVWNADTAYNNAECCPRSSGSVPAQTPAPRIGRPATTNASTGHPPAPRTTTAPTRPPPTSPPK